MRCCIWAACLFVYLGHARLLTPAAPGAGADAPAGNRGGIRVEELLDEVTALQTAAGNGWVDTPRVKEIKQYIDQMKDDLADESERDERATHTRVTQGMQDGLENTDAILAFQKEQSRMDASTAGLKKQVTRINERISDNEQSATVMRNSIVALRETTSSQTVEATDTIAQMDQYGQALQNMTAKYSHVPKSTLSLMLTLKAQLSEYSDMKRLKTALLAKDLAAAEKQTLMGLSKISSTGARLSTEKQATQSLVDGSERDSSRQRDLLVAVGSVASSHNNVMAAAEKAFGAREAARERERANLDSVAEMLERILSNPPDPRPWMSEAIKAVKGTAVLVGEYKLVCVNTTFEHLKSGFAPAMSGRAASILNSMLPPPPSTMTELEPSVVVLNITQLPQGDDAGHSTVEAVMVVRVVVHADAAAAAREAFTLDLLRAAVAPLTPTVVRDMSVSKEVVLFMGSATPSCPGDCSGHGRCLPTGCDCMSDWTGEDCARPKCTDGCLHGTCVAPGVCRCSPGWMGQSCSSQVTCSIPIPTAAQTVTCEGPFVGQRCRFSCAADHVLDNSTRATAKCRTTGRWDRPPPYCVPYVCPEPPSPYPHGQVSCTGFSVNETCHFVCPPTHDLVPADGHAKLAPDQSGITATVSCVKGGVWNGTTAFECVHRACESTPPAITNGSTRCNGLVTGSLCHQTCDAGYIRTPGATVSDRPVPVGTLPPGVLRCTDSKDKTTTPQWAGQAVECKPVDCEEFPGVSHSSTVCTGTTHGSVCTTQCDTGYRLRSPGYADSTCLGVGTWSMPLPKCEPIDCGHPAANQPVAFGHHVCDGTVVGSVCQLTCDSGYVLPPLVPHQRVCQENGVWTGEDLQDATCVRVQCAATPVEGGDVHCTGSQEGDLCTVTCSPDHILAPPVVPRLGNASAPSTRTASAGATPHHAEPSLCTRDGLLPALPRCLRATCEAIERDDKGGKITCRQPECWEHQETVTMTTLEYGWESSWSISKFETGQPDQQAPPMPKVLCASDHPHEAHDTTTSQCCLSPGKYVVTCKDSWGDGWHGGSLKIHGQTLCEDFVHGHQMTTTLIISPRPASTASPLANVSGSVCTLECPVGTRLRGSSGVECRRGRWSRPLGRCETITCDAPPQLPGDASCDDGKYGSWCNHTCSASDPTKPFILDIAPITAPDLSNFTTEASSVVSPADPVAPADDEAEPDATIAIGQTLELQTVLLRTTLGSGLHLMARHMGVSMAAVSEDKDDETGAGEVMQQFVFVGQEEGIAVVRLVAAGQDATQSDTIRTVRVSVVPSSALVATLALKCLERGWTPMEGSSKHPHKTCLSSMQPTEPPAPDGGHVTCGHDATGTFACAYACGSVPVRTARGLDVEAPLSLVGMQRRRFSIAAPTIWDATAPVCEHVHCPPLPLGPDMVGLDCSGSPTGPNGVSDQCQAVCLPSMVPDGRPVSCGVGGAWDGPTPRCVAGTCEPMVPPPNAYVDCRPSDRRAGGACFIKCKPGYRQGSAGTSPNVAYCKPGGKWYVPLTANDKCVPVTCPELDEAEDGNVTSTGQGVGSVATYSCMAGFRLSGPQHRSCLAGGVWSGTPAVCIAPACPPPPPPAHGAVACEETTVGATCHVTCETGYEHSTAAVAVQPLSQKCSATGVWLGVAANRGSCERTTCPRLPVTPGLRLHCTGGGSQRPQYMDTCTGVCGTGYRLVGAERLVCTVGGRWDYPPPSCVPIRCPALDADHISDSMGGTLTCTGTGGAVGDTCTLECGAEHRVVGTAVRECGSGGQWTGATPACVNVNCGSPPVLNDGQIVCSNGTGVGSACTASCLLGFKLEGSSTRTCLASRQWTGVQPVCNKISCGVLARPEHATMECTSTTVLGHCVSRCDPGHVNVSGSVDRVCLSDGTWLGSPLVCKPTVCPVAISGPMPDGLRMYCSGDGDPGVGSVCHYSCEEGKRLQGPSLRHCAHDGRWSDVQPSCVPITCGFPPLPDGPYPQPKCTGTGYNTSCVVQCTDDPLDNTTLACASDGKWRRMSGPPCRYVSCAAPSLPPGMIHGCHAGTWVGGECRTACDKAMGFVDVAAWGERSPKSEGVLTCAGDGTWTETIPLDCQVPSCAPLPHAPNGRRVCTGHGVGDTCHILCDAGYEPQSSDGHDPEPEPDSRRANASATNPVRRCMRPVAHTARGRWAGRDQHCVPVQCEKLVSPPHTDMRCTGHTFGDMCYFKCMPGHALSNGTRNMQSRQMFCQANGVWSNRLPECVAQTCPSLPSGAPSASSCGLPSMVPAIDRHTCLSQCKPGETGGGAYHCGPSGWAGHVQPCQPISCGAPINPPEGAYTCTKLTPGGTCVLNCDSKFASAKTLQWKQPKLACSTAGAWEGMQAVCLSPLCPALPMVPHAQVTCNGTSMHDVCNVVCNEGYARADKEADDPADGLRDMQKLVCGGYGEWTGELVDCVAKSCEPPDVTSPALMSCSGHEHGDRCIMSCDTGHVPSFETFLRNLGSDTLHCEHGVWVPHVWWADDATPPLRLMGARQANSDEAEVVRNKAELKGAAGAVAGTVTAIQTMAEAGSGSKGWPFSKEELNPAGKFECEAIECTPPSSPDNAHVTCPSLPVFMDHCDMWCYDGFEQKPMVLNHSSHVCLESGAWTNRFNSQELKCKRITCPPLLYPPHVHVNCDMSSDGPFAATPGVTCKVTCDGEPGYEPRGSSSVTHECMPSGEWTHTSDMLQCDPLSCEEFSPPEMARTTHCGGHGVGDVCEMECRLGYQLPEDPDWNSNELDLSVGSDVHGEAASEQASALLEVDSAAGGPSPTNKWRGETRARAKCGLDGAWTGPAARLSCEPAMCASEPEFHRPVEGSGSMDCDGTEVGSICEVTCNAGYSLEGSSVVTCVPGPIDQDGTHAGAVWADPSSLAPNVAHHDTSTAIQTSGFPSPALPAPPCVPIRCSEPPASPMAVLVSSPPSSGEYAFGDSAEYECMAGHTLYGDAHRTCSADGTWSGRSVRCVPVDCGEPANPRDGNVHCPNGTSYSKTCTYGCLLPSTDTSKVPGLRGGQITCGDRGAWVPSTGPLACIFDECPALPPLEHGSMRCDGKICTGVRCDTGYELHDSDSSTLHCEDGAWSGRPPACVPITCPLPDPPRRGRLDHSLPATMTAGRACEAALDPDACMAVGCCRYVNGACLPATNAGASCEVAQVATLTVMCDEGHEMPIRPPARTMLRQCLAGGDYSGYDVSECERVKCGPPGPLLRTLDGDLVEGTTVHDELGGTVAFKSHKRVSGWGVAASVHLISGEHFGDVVLYNCPTGHTLVGASHRLCQSDGTWSDREPTCVPDTCSLDAIPYAPHGTPGSALSSTTPGALDVIHHDTENGPVMVHTMECVSTEPGGSCTVIFDAPPPPVRAVSLSVNLRTTDVGASDDFLSVNVDIVDDSGGSGSSVSDRCGHRPTDPWSCDAHPYAYCIESRPITDMLADQTHVSSINVTLRASPNAHYCPYVDADGTEHYLHASVELMVSLPPSYAAMPPIRAGPDPQTPPSGLGIGIRVPLMCPEGTVQRGGELETECLGGQDPQHMWSRSSAVCEPVSCGQPPASPNTIVSCTGTSLNDKCRHECVQNAVPAGPHQFGPPQQFTSCTLSGAWSAPPLSCEIPVCPPPPSAAHTHYSCPEGHELGATCTVTCSPPYELVWEPGHWHTWFAYWNDVVEIQCRQSFLAPSGTKALWAGPGSTGSCQLRSCPDLSMQIDLAPALSVNCSRATHDHAHECAFTCLPGHVMGGPSSISCDPITGDWTASPPTCRPLTCSSPPLLPSHNLISRVPDTVAPDTVVVIACALGFAPADPNATSSSYPLSTVCQTDTTWGSSPPTCLPALCPAPPVPGNGSTTLSSESAALNTKAIFSCPAGFVLPSAGPALSTCLVDLNVSYGAPLVWAPATAPACEPVVCPPLPVVPNARIVCSQGGAHNSTALHGSVCHYSCEDGFSLRTAIRTLMAECGEGGLWESDGLPTCAPTECDMPTPGPLREVTCASSPPIVDTECVFECRAGHSFDGVASTPRLARVCTGTKQFNDTVPPCSRTACAATPPAVPHASVNLDGPSVEGTTAEYVCDSGYGPAAPSMSLACTDGAWTGSTPSCERVVCPAPVSPVPSDAQAIEASPTAFARCEDGFSLGHPAHTYGSTCTYHCPEGHRPVLPSTFHALNVSCTQSGEWSGSPPECHPAECGGPLLVPAHGSSVVSLPCTTYGCEAAVACPNGTVLLRGSAHLTCGAEGAWMGEAAECGPATVPGIPTAEFRPTQSSSTLDGDAAYALTTDLYSQTYAETDPWWAVDLGERYVVKTVSLGVPDAMPATRVPDVTVEYAGADGTWRACGVGITLTRGDTVPVGCGDVSTSRIRVSITGAGRVLALCRVSITGVPVIPKPRAIWELVDAAKAMGVTADMSGGPGPSIAGRPLAQGGCAVAPAHDMAWYRVDLGAVRRVHSVGVSGDAATPLQVRVGHSRLDGGMGNALCGPVQASASADGRVECGTVLEGRYVSVHAPARNATLRVCGLTVTTDLRPGRVLDNLALHKQARSDAGATDAPFDDTCFVSPVSDAPYWAVDLQAPASIDHVVVRMGNAGTATLAMDTATATGRVVTSAQDSLCAPPRSAAGRAYVHTGCGGKLTDTVTLAAHGWNQLLSLCAVEVWGTLERAH